MKKIIKYNFIALLAIVFLAYSCSEDDNTGYSKLVPTSPTITVSGIAAGGYNLTETNTTYSFDVTLSVAQVADVALYVTQIDGDAEMGVDFSIVNSNNRVYIPANSTTGKLEIKVLSDELIEGTETFTLQIGDERTTNATVTPVEVTFTLSNYTNEFLDIDLSWETDVLDVIGLELDPADVGELSLLVFDASDVLVIDAEGTNYSGLDTMPDGVYTLAAAFTSATDFGDLSEAVNFDITLDFFQAGVIDKSLPFPAVIDNLFPCYDFRVYLATVTKAGSTYTIAEEITYSIPERTAWYGYDAYTVFGDYTSEVETAQGCDGDLLIYGLNAGWMFDFWGETIVDEGNVRYVINEYTNEITIAEQYVFTTDYEGDLYPYTISGTGTYDNSGAFPTMHIEYVLDQDGFDPSGWAFNAGYQATPYFEANLTLDPSGKKATVVSTTKKFDLNQKPVR
ncbi:MAG TPA: hypothetical protein DCG75_13180 [Bacteroidales bacterium]|jgi:hypothetical protein|nr:hypothetical protein [Bacteroidales bacterium]